MENIVLKEYSERSFVVTGDTKPIKEELKKLGGMWFKKESGWLFSNKRRANVEAYLNTGVVKGDATKAKAKAKKDNGAMFVKWLDEFIAAEGKDANYYRKEFVGAIKLRGKYFLMSKPNIKKEFCFHDEGEDYELYKELHADKKKMEEYFRSANMAQYDEKIERMKNGNEVWMREAYRNSRIELMFFDGWWKNPTDVECTGGERVLIREGLEFARRLFEKRVDAYLKRYGVDKLHTWTYWADR